MRKAILLVFVLMLVAAVSWAQRTVSGRITDETGAPLANASITIKGTKTGTATSAEGFYTITVPARATSLVFSHLGKSSQELAIGTRTTLDVQLKNSDKALDEVVVVGYTVQRKKDVAAAISKIDGDDIARVPVPSFAQAMQGQAPGVAVAATSGIPGGAINVTIRGVGSLNAGNTPLYVVDGIQINTSLSGSIGGSSASGSSDAVKTQNNPLAFLNPNDIESIEILKDAAAAAIYGAKAAGGVVLVTTKRGGSGKAKFNVHLYYGQTKATKLQQPLTTQEWLQARIEGIVNTSGFVTTVDAAKSQALTEIGQPGTLTDKEIAALNSTDWMKASWGTGQIKSAELSMQAGTQATSLYMSGSYNYQTAQIKPTNFERGTFLIKGSHKVSYKFTVDASINLSTFAQKANFGQGGGNNNTINAAYAAAQILPINPIYRPDGQFYGLSGSGDAWYGGFANNPIAAQNLLKISVRTNQLVGGVSGTYRITPDLSIKSFAGLDYRLAQVKSYLDPRLIGGLYDGVRGTGEVGSNWTTNFITTTVANYLKSIREVHNISALLGIEYRNDMDQQISATGNSFPSSDFQYLNSAATPVAVTESWTGYATFSQFARLGYNYRSRYVVGFTLRRDGSSRFGANNLYGTFPSVQVAWNASEERFLSNVNSISQLKFRYSYGRTGNDQVGNFDSRGLYGGGRIYNGAGAINPTNLGNPNLTWETRTEHNVGLDLGLFNNKIVLTADAYRRVNVDLLLDRSLLPSTGWTTISQNTGSLMNRGIELMLTLRPLTGDLKLESSFNFTATRNKILSLYDGLQVLPGDASVKVGEWAGSHFLARWAGVNPATGRSMWYDINGNITYQPTTADRVFVGKIYPAYFGGWTNTLSFKGFELHAFLQYEYGRRRFDNQLQQEARLGSSGSNTHHYIYDNRWTTPGQIAVIPKPLSSQTEQVSSSWNTGDHWYYKTDYIRLKQVTLSYNVQPTALKRIGFTAMRVYLQGLNLWTYTKFPGYDPEYTGTSSTIIPQTKNMTVGIQAGF